MKTKPREAESWRMAGGLGLFTVYGSGPRLPESRLPDGCPLKLGLHPLSIHLPEADLAPLKGEVDGKDRPGKLPTLHLQSRQKAARSACANTNSSDNSTNGDGIVDQAWKSDVEKEKEEPLFLITTTFVPVTNSSKRQKP